MVTTWKEELTNELLNNNEKLKDIIHNTLTDEQMLEEFDDGFGGSEGDAFTAWSKNFVYFPVVYDGSEWVSSVSRNPCDVATEHIGGQ